jgi:hypothetical protein
VHYLLPLKARSGGDLAELGAYVRRLRRHLPVLVVDASEAFDRNAALFTGATHLRPDPRFDCANGKVAGVLTGFAHCPSDDVLVADDDVRYEPAQLAHVARLLRDADVVIPQNYYDPLPWQACWDTARILVNRALPAGDYPGTLAVRLTGALRELGYDGDVLFENLELIRTVRADGGRAVVARDLFVRRLPPDVRHFLGQRVRQAYDSQAQPRRLTVELSLLPALAAGVRRPGVLGAVLGGSIVLAEFGRRRAGGASVFPVAATLLAPLWVLERAVCAWVALGRRVLRGGTVYAGRRITRAATSPASLRRRRAAGCGCRRRTA